MTNCVVIGTKGLAYSITMKKFLQQSLCRELENRTEKLLNKAQVGFRPDISTINQLFTIRRLSEMYTEFGKTLFVCYVGFQKECDSVWKIVSWRVMRFLGYDEKIARLLLSLYMMVLQVLSE